MVSILYAPKISKKVSNINFDSLDLISSNAIDLPYLGYTHSSFSLGPIQNSNLLLNQDSVILNEGTIIYQLINQSISPFDVYTKFKWTNQIITGRKRSNNCSR
jgi:hypothetical protein